MHIAPLFFNINYNKDRLCTQGDLDMKNLKLRAYFAEALGTFALVFVGTSTPILTSVLGVVNPVATALATGLIVMVMIYAVGHISGGHFNPAVSLAMVIRKDLSWKDFGFYVVFQLFGAFIASLFLGIFIGSFSNLAATDLSASLADPAVLVGLLVEVILTFLFVTVILAVTANEKYSNVVGLVIGLALTALIFAGIGYTGAGFNPARSIAPAILQGGSALTNLWLYIVGPLVGGMLAAFVHIELFKKPKAE